MCTPEYGNSISWISRLSNFCEAKGGGVRKGWMKEGRRLKGKAPSDLRKNCEKSFFFNQKFVNKLYESIFSIKNFPISPGWKTFVSILDRMLAGGRKGKKNQRTVVIDDDGFSWIFFSDVSFAMFRFHRHTIGSKTFVCYDKQENYADIL